jgi:hypothetical protein
MKGRFSLICCRKKVVRSSERSKSFKILFKIGLARCVSRRVNGHGPEYCKGVLDAMLQLLIGRRTIRSGTRPPSPRNRERLQNGDVLTKFMTRLLNHSQVKSLLSDGHFSVDGTLIEAWASQKSFRPKEGSGDDDDGANFHGQKRKRLPAPPAPAPPAPPPVPRRGGLSASPRRHASVGAMIRR